MIKCKTCGHKIATSDKTCPECGSKTHYKLWRVAKILWSILGVIIVVVVVAGISADPDDIARQKKTIEAERAAAPKRSEPSSSSSIPTMRTRSGYFLASINKDWLDRAVEFSVAGDHAALQKLIDAEMVFPLKAGMEVFIEEGGFFAGIVKIRPKGSNLSLYTIREAVGK